jgi:hypothetical protein
VASVNANLQILSNDSIRREVMNQNMKKYPRSTENDAFNETMKDTALIFS